MQLAWRFLRFQSDSALAKLLPKRRTKGRRQAQDDRMIVALARKGFIALWRLVTVGEIPLGVRLRPTMA